jgi:hypothetical protein
MKPTQQAVSGITGKIAISLRPDAASTTLPE